MEKSENQLIKMWHFGASFIVLGNEKNATETVMLLAQQQLEMLENTKPNKEKPLKEQCNEEQQELINYLEKIANTGEF